MDNHIFYDPIRKLTISLLDKFFKVESNKKYLNIMIGFIKENMKARLAATNSRKSNKKSANFLESSLIAGYYPPNLLGKSKVENPLGCEIYVVEGDSASTNARTGRFDPDIQGVLGLGGKPTNAWKLVDDKKPTPDIITFFDDVLGCGWGSHFVLENCLYDRIIIGADSDIDGNHICGIIVANIYKYARPLLENGMVYRVITPLYMLKQKTQSKAKRVDTSLYLYNKESYFEAYERIASETYKLKYEESDRNYVSKENMISFLQTNSDYYTQIDVLAKQNTTHPDIIEFLANHINDFGTTINKVFPEITYDTKNHYVSGAYAGDFHAFILDEDTLSILHQLHQIIVIGNQNHFRYNLYKVLKSGKTENMGRMTIFQIMQYCVALMPEIESRFKGQGELDPIEFKALAMNPNVRSLVRINILDAESTYETILDLFSDDRTSVRKQMIIDADISIDDIDN